MIKVNITDKDALEAIAPSMFESWLEAHGWTYKVCPSRNLDWHINEWSHPGYLMIDLPSRSLGDWVTRCSETLTYLAKITGRSELDIYAEIAPDEYRERMQSTDPVLADNQAG